MGDAATDSTIPGQDILAGLLSQCADPVIKITHPPVHTVAEAQPYWDQIEGAHTKNLLLKDNRGKLWLVTMQAERRADLKALTTLLGAKRVSFASAETLLASLGVTPGAVTPLGLVNDTEHQVGFVLDKALAEAGRITCHPLVNTATVSLSSRDLLTLLQGIGASVQVLDLDQPPAG